MEREQRERYIRLLRQKLKIKATLHTCVCLFKNLMKTGDYVQAEEILGADGSEMASQRRILDSEDTVSGGT